MSVLINFKICDNSEDCSGISVCPVKAFYWDDKNRTIVVDNSKCINCGKCEEACPVDAIKVAKNQTEFKKFKKEINNDSRNVSDLFVDRYGAQPIHPAFSIPEEKFEVQILKSVKPAVAELFNRDSIQCLLRSVPVRELFKDADIKYRKVELKSDALPKKYGIKTLPALLFFRDGKLIGKIEGYYGIGKKAELIGKINALEHGAES